MKIFDRVVFARTVLELTYSQDRKIQPGPVNKIFIFGYCKRLSCFYSIKTENLFKNVMYYTLLNNFMM